MIDYTYWQDRVRLHLQNDSFAYRAVSVGNAAHFYLRLQEMNDEREAAWQTFLDEFQAREEKKREVAFSTCRRNNSAQRSFGRGRADGVSDVKRRGGDVYRYA